MARMQGLEDREASWLARFIFRAVRKRVGSVSDTWRIAARQPGLLFGWALHEYAYELANGLDRRLRTLAQLKVAALVGCPV